MKKVLLLTAALLSAPLAAQTDSIDEVYHKCKRENVTLPECNRALLYGITNTADEWFDKVEKDIQSTQEGTREGFQRIIIRLSEVLEEQEAELRKIKYRLSRLEASQG